MQVPDARALWKIFGRMTTRIHRTAAARNSRELQQALLLLTIAAGYCALKDALFYVDHIARLNGITLLRSDSHFTPITTFSLNVHSAIATPHSKSSGTSDRLDHRHSRFKSIFVGLLYLSIDIELVGTRD